MCHILHIMLKNDASVQRNDPNMGSTLVIQKDGSLSKSKVDRLWPPKRWHQGKVWKGFRDRLQPTFSAALPYCITPFCFLFFLICANLTSVALI